MDAGSRGVFLRGGRAGRGALAATFAAAGLHGLEVLRPRLGARDRGRLRRLARKHGLVLTGGSDWHGWAGERVGLFSVQLHEIADFVDTLAA